MTHKKNDIRVLLNIINWLKEVGLLENKAIHLRAVQNLRNPTSSILQNYLKKNPKLIQEGKRRFQLLKLIEEECPFFPFPESEAFQGTIPLGYVHPVKKNEFRMREKDLPMHMLVMGQTGGGKSNFVKVAITSIYEKANAKFWIFDPQKEYRDLKHYGDFLILRVKQFWDNPFERPSKKIEHKDWLEIICQIFEREQNFQSASKNILFDTLNWLFEKRKVYDGKESYPTCRDVLNVLRKKQQYARTFQERNSFEPLINRFNALCNIGQLFTTPKSVPIENLLGQNIIFEHESLMSESFSLFSSVILSKSFYYRMHHPENNHYQINVVEEARAFFDVRRSKNITLGEPTLNKIISQYRKFNGSFIIITQEPSSISDTPKANVYTTVALPMISGKEALSVQQTMLLSQKQFEFYKTMPIGNAIIKYGGMNPFWLIIPKFPETEVVPTDEEILSAMDAFLKPFKNRKKESWQGVKPNQNKAEGQFKRPDSTDQSISGDELKVIYYIQKEPFLKFTQLQKSVGFGAAKLNRICKILQDHKYVTSEKIKASKGKPSRFIILTDKAYKLVKGKKPKGKGSFKSKLYSFIIQEYLKKHNWKARIEGQTSYSNKLIDVLGYKKGKGYYAFEITNSLENINKNIQKDLLESKVSKVVLVFEDSKIKERGRSKLSNENSINELVELKTIKNFF